MKKVIFLFAIGMAFTASTMLTSCQSPAEKAEDAQNDMQDARQEMTEAEREAAEDVQEAVSQAEWETFKADAEAKIEANEERIKELRKDKRAMPGKAMDEVYKQKIDALQERNKDLRKKIADRKPEDPDWAAFKREFNHDMDELGNAFEDLTVNNEN